MNSGFFDGLWESSPRRIFSLSAILSPVSVLATIALSVLITQFFSFSGTAPNSVGDVIETGLTGARVFSALFAAPLIENFVCLVLASSLGKWTPGNWWIKPLLISMMAAIFHCLVLFDFRPFAVLPGFFVMCSLIVNVKNRKIGFWSSVLHHFLINSINLSVVAMA